jgi:hypothetical protein
MRYLKGRTFRCAITGALFLVIPNRLQPVRDLRFILSSQEAVLNYCRYDPAT